MKHITLAFVLLTAATAAAQTPSAPDQNRWAPWLGCWQIAEESVEDVDRMLAEIGGTSASRSNSAGARVCVTPAPDGATMTTLVNGKQVLVETIVADGQSRPLSDAKCRGAQQAEWSQLAARVYARTEVACGEQPQRTVSGMSTIVSGPVWLDIQMIESQGRKSMRVRRYRRAADQTGALSATPRELGTMPIGGKFTIADIKEASAKVPPEAVQAAVLELGGSGYDINARRLIELDDAGVADSVIDLMVAMSFPKKFVVERAVPRSGPGGFDSGLWAPYSMWPYYAHSMYYSAYYSPFGYNYWGYNDPYYYGYGGYYGPPGVVIIDPPGTGSPGEPSGNGRVVDGAGYTRIRPNVPEPSRTGNSGAAANSGSAAGSSGTNSGSSGGSVSTGGYSGGGGGGERVAVPRPPGGN
jgi:uncharacterized membrane protein YgcG